MQDSYLASHDDAAAAPDSARATTFLSAGAATTVVAAARAMTVLTGAVLAATGRAATFLTAAAPPRLEADLADAARVAAARPLCRDVWDWSWRAAPVVNMIPHKKSTATNLTMPIPNTACKAAGGQ
jgi:hypothetical protein